MSSERSLEYPYTDSGNLKANDVFKTPQEASIDEDKKCEDRIANADIVMKHLVVGVKTSYELQQESGLSEAEVRNAIHYLRKQIKPAFIDVLDVKDTHTGRPIPRKYYLTDAGRKNLPAPKPVDWHSPEVDPRKTPRHKPDYAKNTPRIKTKGHKGTTHIKGLVGKVIQNADGSISLKGKSGEVYEALKTHGSLTSKGIVNVTKINEPYVWNILSKLKKANLIDTEDKLDAKGRQLRHYFAVGHEPQPKTPPATKTKPSTPPELNTPAPPPAKTPDDGLTDSIQRLRHEYGDEDILLTVMSLMHDELNELRRFKALVQDSITQRNH